jgi:single-stranded-DNA-specific exonuclease
VTGAFRPNSALLGVDRSILGRRWASRLSGPGEALAEALTQAHGYDAILARILAARGVAPEAAPAYLEPALRDLLPDPFALLGMEEATQRLADAVQRGEQIAVFGDYDVDGACSSALLADYFVAAGAPAPLIHIPDRIIEGYGPNVEAIRELAAREARLLVTVDCGTTSHAALAEAGALGLGPIVFDHHQAGELLPEAVVVNPNRQDDVSGQGALCAAGVVFLALVALNRELRRRGWWGARREPDLLAALDLVALATVADVAPLTGLNRAFVAKGLAVMRRRERVGLSALMEAARMDGAVKPYHLGFLLGPRINAGGRIGDSGLGARLLTLGDPAEASRIARDLDRLNGERQVLEKATVELAVAAADREQASSNRRACLVVGDEAWHPGVLGLVASKLKDRFNSPSFAIAFSGDIGTGSGRSLSGVDLGFAVRRAVEAAILMKGGGHAMAAGVTLARDRLEAFRNFMNEALEAQVARAREEDALCVDAVLTARGASADLLRRVETAGPYGQGNPEPLFALSAHRISYAAQVGESHVRTRLTAGDGAAIDAICFRALETPLGAELLEGRGRAFHVAARLSLSQWRGAEKPEAQIVDLARAE